MRQEMLIDLASAFGNGDVSAGLAAAYDFLRRYEGAVVCKLRPQYQRIRAREMYQHGQSYMEIAEELNISPRHVFNLLHN